MPGKRVRTRRPGIKTIGPMSFVISLTVALAGLVGACNTVNLPPDEEFRVLFSGYTLTRTGQLSADATLAEGGLAALRDPILRDTRLTPGHGYGFRKANDWRNEKVALVLLPERLKKIGARVVKAPRSDREMIYAIMGGPFFRIEFEKDGHTGTIFNRLAYDESEGPEGSEVLVLIYR